MKRNKILNTILVLFFCASTLSMQAQLGKIGKNLKKNVKKNVNKVEHKTDNDGYSDECLRLKKNMDNRAEKAEMYLKENNMSLAGTRIRDLGRFIEQYKDKNCPLVGNYVKKHEELEKQYNLKNIQNDPFGFMISGVNEASMEKIDLTLSQGADINQINNQKSALLVAVEKSNLEIVKYVIDKGANVNLDNGFDTPLEKSVKIGNLEIFKYLLSKGAKAKSCKKNLVLYVAHKKNLEMMKELSENQNIDITTVEDDPQRHLLSRKGTALSYTDEGSELQKYIIAKVEESKLAKIKDATNKKYANRLVFSTEKIPSAGASSSKFGEKFQACNNFFGRIYLSSLYSELYYGTKNSYPDSYENTFYVWAQLDGDTKKFNIDNIKVGGKHDASTYEAKINTREYRAAFHRLFIRLKQGDNKVTFWVINNNDKIISETITLTKKPGDTFKVGKTFADFKTGMKNSNLEAGILKSIKSRAANAGWDETFKKVKIASTDWTIIRHEISGRILGRYLSAYCYAQWPDGHCTVQLFTLQQEYNGSSYSSTFQKHSNGSQEDVDCN